MLFYVVNAAAGRPHEDDHEKTIMNTGDSSSVYQKRRHADPLFTRTSAGW